MRILRVTSRCTCSSLLRFTCIAFYLISFSLADYRDDAFAGKKKCLTTEFECANGKCIPNSWHCDGENDCRDGSDENPAVCRLKPCAETEFQCSPGECIPKAWLCDHQFDCKDGLDEKNCRKNNHHDSNLHTSSATSDDDGTESD